MVSNLPESEKMNLFQLPEAPSEAEWVCPLLVGRAIRIERIVSDGQASPEGFWYDQEQDEWVALLQGSATLCWGDGSVTDLRRGDWVLIPAHKRHRVEWTSSEPPCIWLAVHANF